MGNANHAYSTLYAQPDNGWDASCTADNAVPENVSTMLDNVFRGWVFMGDHFVLLPFEGEAFFWKRGESITVSSDFRLLDKFNSADYFGFPIIDRSTAEINNEIANAKKILKVS